MMKLIFGALALVFFISPLVAPASADISKALLERGQLLNKSTEHGSYMQYVPNSATRFSKILVVAHGSLSKKESANDLAKKFIRRWMPTAERQKVILIAPAFNARDYQAYGGYRGLFGRNVGADIFVQQIVKLYSRDNNLPKFYLYGHSAGAQFVIRYLLRHPNTLLAAVASAPGRYAFPDTSAAWPYGMAPLRRTIKYSNPAQEQKVEIIPKRQSWLKASSVPLRIVVGAKDLQAQPQRPAHMGKTRVELALNWTSAIKSFARSGGRTANFEVIVVPNIAHNSRRLTPHCIKALFPK